MQEIQFYKSNETLSNKFYQIPQELFVSSLYKDKLNSDSKILYGFLLDRIGLSISHRWIDKNDCVFLIFTRKELQELLNLSDKTITKAFRELRECELIYEKKQGCSKPNIIYVGKVQSHPEDN